MIQFQRNFRRGGCNFSPILLFSKIIPRQIFYCYELNSIELHGFSDASLQGYGAVLYVKAQAANGYQRKIVVCKKSSRPFESNNTTATRVVRGTTFGPPDKQNH
jgi:hypothetical protein